MEGLSHSPPIPVGAELARDSGGSACIEVERIAAIASKLGSHTGLGCSWNRCSPQTSVGTSLLAIAVCLRRCGWMCRPLREQARSHNGSVVFLDPASPANSPVGASLLAMAQCRATFSSTDTPPSRASPLPQ
ncbi:hypothetical protein DZG01_08175 [Pseudomonas fluorescens]|nr:hypothetical protein DZG01_08175 [Pseudomonas fluorescens]